MESYTIESNKKKSRIPARLDFLQSSTGLFLGLFVWLHIVLNASIILGPGAFNWVSKNMELAFLSDTGHGYPIVVFFAVFVVFTLFVVHALLGIRKFPVSWKQHRIMKDQIAMMKHQDTNLWYIQVVTGFIMFFAGSVHLYSMLTHPGSIDLYLCADRVVSQNMWFVYLILLVCVVLHGNIGLYRLCMKWGWFQGSDYKRARKNRIKLKNLCNKLIIIFLCAGLLALLIFVIVGLRYKDAEPYKATHAARTHEAEPAAVDAFHEEPFDADAVHEKATPPVEETLTHDNAPAVQEFESTHEDVVNEPGDVQEGVQEEAAGDDDVAHEAESAAAESFHEEPFDAEAAHEQIASPIEETVTHDNAPVFQESEPAHDDAMDDPGDVQEELQEEIQEEAAGDEDAAQEAPFDDAGPSESEENAVEGEANHTIDGGRGPHEIL